jgi:F-type H+-transporting ATPase subunit epsilon
MPAFAISLLTPERQVYTGRAVSLVAPGSDGYLGVLAYHAPLVAELTVGKLSLVEEKGRRRLFAVSGGVLEAGGNEVTILADAAEPAEGIDLERARAAERRAGERLGQRGEVDVARAQAALQRALNRLRVAGAGPGL